MFDRKIYTCRRLYTVIHVRKEYHNLCGKILMTVIVEKWYLIIKKTYNNQPFSLNIDSESIKKQRNKLY